MTIRFAASIVLGLVASTAAFAAEPDAASAPTAPVATVNATASAATIAAARKANTRYCLRHEVPASRIMTKVCDTRQNLTAMGYDMDAVLNDAR